MELLKDTPFEVGWSTWPIRPPDLSLTIVVKATFTLVPSGPCPVADEQQLLTGDLHVDDDPERGLLYGSDLAPVKTRGEVSLSGSCHCPGGAPVTQTTVGLSVGAVAKQLAVFGDRYFKGGILGGRIDPAPFEQMPLTWERSFGGPGHPDNPVGKGMVKVDIEGGKSLVPLPNLEDPRALIGGARDRPVPVGLGPIERMWRPRARLTGTYNASWHRTRWPWLPADFDWEHFNHAPADQRITGYFRGDERIQLQNLTAEHARVDCQLPGLRARAFVRRAGDEALREVALVLDTIHIDGDRGEVLCLWRGVTEVADDVMSDIDDLFVVHEPLGAPARDYAEWFASVAAAGAAEEAAFEAEPVPAAEEVMEQRPPEVHDAPRRPTAVLFDDQAPERLTRMLADQGEIAPPPVEDAVRPTMIFEDPAPGSVPPPPLGAPAIDAALPPMPAWVEAEEAEEVDEGGRSALVPEPSVPPPAAEAAEPVIPELPPPVREAPVPPPADDAQVQRATRFLEEELSGAAAVHHDEEEVHRATVFAMEDEEETEQDRVAVEEWETVAAVKPIAELAEAFALRARLQELLRTEGSCAGADLAGVSVHGMDLRDVDFTGAILTGADFLRAQLDGAKLDNATLVGARLSRATLRRASLRGANLTGVHARYAHFEDADLTDSLLADASMAHAHLKGSCLDGVDLSGADLSHVAAVNVSFDGADLSRAILDDATLVQCRMVDAWLDQASAKRLCAAGCDLTKLRASDGTDLTEADLHEATLDGARFGRSRLDRADLSFASIEGADFSDARLLAARLLGANLRKARFDNARMLAVRLGGSDLFEARLEGADLTDADLKGCNLFGAELWRARIRGAVFDLCNLTGTKLEGGIPHGGEVGK